MAESADSARDAIPVIGIGSSAGGIAPLKKLFEIMPADLGAAFVLIPHLSPDHESQVCEILQKSTKMPVTTVKTRSALEPDHVYVIPPGAYLTLEGDELISSEPQHPRGHRRPVDTFFTTLAESKGPRGIAIILSGMDANGTSALREVKAEGGFVIVQDPAEAEFASMPQRWPRGWSIWRCRSPRCRKRSAACWSIPI